MSRRAQASLAAIIGNNIDCSVLIHYLHSNKNNIQKAADQYLEDLGNNISPSSQVNSKEINNNNTSIQSCDKENRTPNIDNNKTKKRKCSPKALKQTINQDDDEQSLIIDRPDRNIRKKQSSG